MTHTQFVSGRSNTRSLSSLTLNAVTRLAIGLVIVVLIVIRLTNPSGAQMNRGAKTESTPSSPEEQVSKAALFGNAALFDRCLQDWDAATHMTKKEWSGACQRLQIERRDYLPKQRQ